MEAQDYASKLVPNPYDPVARPNELVDVYNPQTGRSELRPRVTVDPTKEQIIGQNIPEPYIQYGGVANAIQTFGRSLSNTLSLGGYALLTDRYRTEEERKEIKRRDLFHKGAEFAGAATGYLLPILGEFSALGAGARAAAELAIVPNLGNLAANAAFKAESEVAKRFMTMGAIDGLAQGFTQGANEASLDGFSQESINAWLTGTALGGVLGTGFGAALGSIAPLTRAAKNIIAGGENKLPLKFDPAGDFMKAQNTIEEVGINKAELSNVYDRAAPLFNKPSAELTTEERADRNFYKSYLSWLARDTHHMDDFFETGLKNFKEHFEAARELNLVEREFGPGRPIRLVVSKVGDAINNAINRFSLFRQESTKIRRLFDPATLDTEIGQDAAFNLATAIAEGDTSMLNRLQEDLRDIIDPKRTVGRASAEYFAEHGYMPDEKALAEGVKRLKTGIKDDFVNEMLSALSDAGRKQGVLKASEKFTPDQEALLKEVEAEFEAFARKSGVKGKLKEDIRNNFYAQRGVNLFQTASKAELAPSKLWRFLEEAHSNVNNVRYSKKYSKEGLTKEEKALFAKIRTEIETSFKNFGPQAEKEARIRTALNNVSVAQKDLKRVLKAATVRTVDGKELEDIDIDAFQKLVAFNKSTGKPSLRAFEPALKRYFAAFEENIPVIARELGMSESEVMGSISAEGAEAFKRYKQAQALSNRSMQRWYEFQESSIASAAKNLGPSIGVSPLTRIIRGSEDLLFPGEERFARIQFTRLAIESLMRLAYRAKSPATFDEFLQRRVQALFEAQKIAKGTKSRTAAVAKALLKPASAVARVSTKALPYAALLTTRAGREEVSERFEKSVDHLNKIRQNPGEITKLSYHYDPLKYITKDGNSFASNKVLGTLAILMKAVPPGIPVLEGGGNPSLIEQAKFLDKMTAIANPNKMLEMIESGSPSTEMLDVFQQAWPEHWNSLYREVNEGLLTDTDIGIKQRTRILSLFGIQATVMPVAGAEPHTAVAPPPQETGDQNNSAMAKIRVSGPNKLNANKTYGTFTTQGAP